MYYGIYAPYGTISHGTLRNEDLIPALKGELEILAKNLQREHEKRTEKDPDYESEVDKFLAELFQDLDDISAREMSPDYYESEEAFDDYEILEGWLNQFAPPYTYFGALEGDASDFGFWVDYACLEYDIDSGDLPKGDELPETPTESGYFLQVSDHGNMELYKWDGKWRSVWGIV